MSTGAAILQALAFLGTFGGVALLFSASLLFVLVRRIRWAQWMFAGGTALGGVYAAVLLIVGMSSSTRVLGAGAGKPFCEVDCHVVFNVVEVTRTDSGRITVVLREAFDEQSVSERRGNGPLTPGARYVALVDERGRRYEPAKVPAIERDALFSDMRPGEAHYATLSFSLPRGVRPLGLLIESSDLIAPLLIGHERSPFHGKVLLPVGT